MEAGEEMGEGEGEDQDGEEEEEEEEFILPPIRDRAERSRAGMIPIFAFFWGRGGGCLSACVCVCLFGFDIFSRSLLLERE